MMPDIFIKIISFEFVSLNPQNHISCRITFLCLYKVKFKNNKIKDSTLLYKNSMTNKTFKRKVAFDASQLRKITKMGKPNNGL